MNILAKGNMFLSVSRCFCKSCGERPAVLSVFTGSTFATAATFSERYVRDLVDEVHTFILTQPSLPKVLVVQDAGIGRAVRGELTEELEGLPIRVVSDRVEPSREQFNTDAPLVLTGQTTKYLAVGLVVERQDADGR